MIDAAEFLLDRYASGKLTRRQAATALVGLAMAPMLPLSSSAAASTYAAEGESAESEPTFQATELNHLGVRVSDVARSRDFYRKHLGLKILSDNGPSNCFLYAGPHYFGLFRSENPGVDHFAFTVEGYEAGEAVDKLRAVGLAPRRQADRVYFRDPDGLEVQLDRRYGSWPGPLPEEA